MSFITRKVFLTSTNKPADYLTATPLLLLLVLKAITEFPATTLAFGRLGYNNILIRSFFLTEAIRSRVQSVEPLPASQEALLHSSHDNAMDYLF